MRRLCQTNPFAINIFRKKGNINPLWNDIAFFYSIFHFWTVGDAEALQVCVVLVGVGAYDDPLPRQIAHLI